PVGPGLGINLVARSYGDRAAGGGKLDRVLDQVPEYLLDPRGVGVDVMAVGLQIDVEAELLAQHLTAADMECLPLQLVAVRDLHPAPLERGLAGSQEGGASPQVVLS